MPVAQAFINKPLIPAGTHILTLKHVSEELKENRFDAPNPDGSYPKKVTWIWLFVSTMMDDNGVPFEYELWTGNNYGPTSAKLTQLYDSIIPGITVAEALQFDTDKLLGKKFEASFKHEVGQDGKKRAKLVWIKRYAKGATPAPAVVAPPAVKSALQELNEEEEEDVFADE